jgi:Family of unknown function (DUF5996)
MTDPLPDLTGWEPTRDTLHRYARILGAVRRTLVPPHPLWWHISLQVEARGLTTGPMPAPGGGGTLVLRLDLLAHRLELDACGERRSLPLDAGLTATALGRRVLAALAEGRLAVAVDEGKFADDDPRPYRPAAAEAYLGAVRRVDAAFRQTARQLAGDTGPVQLWPHHFDLSFEWFGDRKVKDEGEEGEEVESRAQIGFGFSPGDESHAAPYFYANPWPFEAAFTTAPLPPGAEWYEEAWEGSRLPYAAARQAGEGRLREYLRAVYDAAAPSLSG